MEWQAIVDFLVPLSPWVTYILVGLGTLTVIGTGVDKLIPDEKDGGFMKKVLAFPIVGGFLTFITKFSPFNVKE